MGSIDLRGTLFEGLVLYVPSSGRSWWEKHWDINYDRREEYCGLNFHNLHNHVQDLIDGKLHMGMVKMSTGTELAAMWVMAAAQDVTDRFEEMML